MNHLKWMGHQSTIYDIQKSLRSDTNSCEVTLVGRGNSVRAHRFILSSCSDLLRSLLVDVPMGHECTIMLPDIKGGLLDSVLAFIYLGETCLHSSNLSEFLEVINHLGIKSAISFECNTGLMPAGGHSPPKAISVMHMQQDEIIEEEQVIGSPKSEEQTVLDGNDQQTTRDLEFLDVYNEPEQKITYSIEHMAATTANEFILTENSGTFTLTQNTKIEDAGIADKVEEPEDDDVDDTGHMMEEYNSTTAAVPSDPIMEIDHSSEVMNAQPDQPIHTKFIKPIKVEKQQQHNTGINVLNDSQMRDESLELAVQGVLNEGMSLQKAAQKYHISKTVLWRRVRKHPMYMKTTRENPMLEAACNRLRSGESLKVISQALDIPMSTLHRHKVRLAQQGRLPDYISFKKRGSVSKEQLKEKLAKAVQACLHEGMSQNHAANMYDIPKSTLWRHLQKRMNDAQMQGLLDEEDVIKEEIILS